MDFLQHQPFLHLKRLYSKYHHTEAIVRARLQVPLLQPFPPSENGNERTNIDVVLRHMNTLPVLETN